MLLNAIDVITHAFDEKYLAKTTEKLLTYFIKIFEKEKIIKLSNKTEIKYIDIEKIMSCFKRKIIKKDSLLYLISGDYEKFL